MFSSTKSCFCVSRTVGFHVPTPGCFMCPSVVTDLVGAQELFVVRGRLAFALGIFTFEIVVVDANHFATLSSSAGGFGGACTTSIFHGLAVLVNVWKQVFGGLLCLQHLLVHVGTHKGDTDFEQNDVRITSEMLFARQYAKEVDTIQILNICFIFIFNSGYTDKIPLALFEVMKSRKVAI